jgi:hypothetical protein
MLLLYGYFSSHYLKVVLVLRFCVDTEHVTEATIKPVSVHIGSGLVFQIFLNRCVPLLSDLPKTLYP